MAMNGKSKVLTLFSVIAVAAIVSSILLVPQMVNAAEADDTSLTTQTSDSAETTLETNTPVLPNWNPDCMDFGRHATQSMMRGFGGFGPVEVSEEFKQTVTSIAKTDTDVQDLINDGYNITSVNPIIKTVIDAEGNVVTKATTAVLTLQKQTTGHATVMVDIEEAKVTQIVILTRTVIDKP
jgi:hypothetical protein